MGNVEILIIPEGKCKKISPDKWIEFVENRDRGEPRMQNAIEIQRGIYMDLWNISDKNHFIDKKTFSKIDFVFTLPKVVLFDERIEIAFCLRLHKEKLGKKIILVAASITNLFNNVTKNDDLDIMLSHNKKVKISFSTKSKPSMANTTVNFLCLSSDGQKYIICYHFERTGMNAELLHVERCAMTEDEKELFIGILKKEAESEKTSKSKTEYQQEKFTYTTNFNILQDYVDALRKEVVYLKTKGGRKHKVSNGKILTHGKEGYCYQFEMESELFLPSDAPLAIDTNAGLHADGSVLSCEEFQIIIIVNKDLGEKIYKAEISVEPWKLLVAQVERISKISNTYNPIAVKLISEGPKLATKQSITNIIKGQESVKERVMKQDITVVWGPPGTGKTYTMSDIAIEQIKLGKSVLIVSHSNVSVDGVIKKVAEKLRKSGHSSLLKEGNVFRYGYIRDIELSKDEYASSFNYAMNHCHNLKKQMDDLLKEKDLLRINDNYSGEKLVEIEKKLSKVRGKIREQEKIYVAAAKLVGTTISKVTVDSLFEDEQYDLVMFDEVSMAYVTQLACAATFANEKFVCVGDFMQLPPIAQDKVSKSVLEKDIFEYLGITDSSENLYYHPWLVMLDTQRRMYPDIADFINRHVYKNLLVNHEDTRMNNLAIVNAHPLAGYALNMIDLHGTYCAASKNADNSRFNILSAIISFSIGLSSVSEDVEKVGIITPYSAQMRLIRALIKDYKSNNKLEIACSTVHQFQGSESDVIVFDAVESYPTSKAGFLMSKNLRSVKRLINVAISRAKGKFINVANGKFWLKEFENQKMHIYYQFVKHLLEKENVISVKERRLQDFLAKLNTGNNIRLYMSQEDCIDTIKKDFEAAKQQIIISIPDGELKGDYNKILGLIEDADHRGVRILMKSNTYEKLPMEWQKYCVGTENAFFPLIMIDDKTIWYGIPMSSGKFQVKDWGFITVCDILIRIKGENTIEMISSLSELSMKRIGNNVTTLLAKEEMSAGRESSISIHSNGGLANWIMKKEFCPECKNYLILAKGRTGKYYLRCSKSSCNHTSFLTKEMINHYININDVSCPLDGGNLTGRLGQYGIYITCSKGHTIKPDQI